MSSQNTNHPQSTSNTLNLPTSEDWHPDILGTGFSALDIPLGEDPEAPRRRPRNKLRAKLWKKLRKEAEAKTPAPAATTREHVQATLVKYQPQGSEDFSRCPAIMWIHGMSDYFFQSHVAEHFHERGYAFYAIDLRKCGRAHRDGQRWHYSSDMGNYFPDLNAGLDVISSLGHPTVIPMAHSTGGLIAPLWLDHLRREDSARHKKISALVLNSPWLDFQFPPILTRIIRPIAKFLGKRFPNLIIPGNDLDTYGKSIHSSAHGEWDFDLRLKPLPGHTKYFTWLAAIFNAQAQIHSGNINVGVPTLVLCSSKSFFKQEYSPASDTADIILDVKQIQDRAPLLGDDIKIEPIDGARHDVYLSLPHALREAYRISDEWLTQQVPVNTES